MAGRFVHPELLPDELFLGNERDGGSGFVTRWESLRRGEVAYDQQGRVLPGFHPAFVGWDEVVSRGYDPTTFGPNRAQAQSMELAR